ncbi:hypothetical protein SEA_TDANISKY_104 [Mycobacterium phage TDanisky]|nr:hypothetical protein SEA_POLLYWOG_97 [Mycobacterium phage Pollywog]QGH71509.1 hypothetical protein SEA_TDANISKY_104 [Mycobacterium phage TDanisky]
MRDTPNPPHPLACLRHADSYAIMGSASEVCPKPEDLHRFGLLFIPGRPPMSTFPAPRTLTERIQGAHLNLKLARQSGNPDIIAAAERILNQLLDRLPRPTRQE